MIARQIAEPIRDLMSKFPVVSVTGPRQSGKTTLLRGMFPDYRYVNFEDPDARLFFEQDPRGFLREYNNHVIFDEAQRVPTLFSYLQVKVDEDKITTSAEGAVFGCYHSIRELKGISIAHRTPNKPFSNTWRLMSNEKHACIEYKRLNAKPSCAMSERALSIFNPSTEFPLLSNRLYVFAP